MTPLLFAQLATNAAVAGTPADPTAAYQPQEPVWQMPVMIVLLLVMFYFVFFRPQSQAKKKQEDAVKAAKTGDRVITSSGIHGYITNVKESTVIVKVSDNTKLEIEKSHIDKITRPANEPEAVKA
jgi:preprotein translocase subunit YajC